MTYFKHCAFGVLACCVTAGGYTFAATQSDPPVGYERRYPIDYAISKRLTGYQEKIFGGRKATSGEIPWQVSIRFVTDEFPDGVHFCGGSLFGE